MGTSSRSNSVRRAALCIAIPCGIVSVLSAAAMAQNSGTPRRESQAVPSTPREETPRDETPQGAIATAAASAEAVPAAQKLLAATVTVRIAAPKSAATAQPALAGGGGVTVCSGVSLGGGKVVTFAAAPADSRFRVTLPGGEQAEARPAVADEYSGLVLLEILRRDQPGVTLAKVLPPVGSAVLTASAAGIELPVVSLGILGGVDRAIPGSELPPLLQCDVRTTDSSSGAAIVDRQGDLIGIVAATSAANGQGGWTYAVPARHVERLIKAHVEGGGTSMRTKPLVVLKRRRPVVGLTMGSGAKEGTVRVERVEPGGPAAAAGIRTGDLILETDGRRIRNAYQAVDLILKKQPGDEIQFLVDHDGASRSVALTLASGATLDVAPYVAGDSPLRVGPQLNVRAMSRNQLEVRQGGRVAELAVEPAAEGEAGASAIGRDEIGLLTTQLAAFEKVIVRLQEELNRRDEHQAKTEALIESLTDEVGELRKRLEAKKE